MKAEEIKKAIIAKKLEKKKTVGEAVILGVGGFLYRASSALFEDYRAYRNAVKDDGTPDYEKRRLANGKLVQISFRDEEGNFVFEDSDVPVIAGIDEIEIFPLCRKIWTVNGLSDESIEALLKNLIGILGVDGLYALLASINAPCPNCSKGSSTTSSESNGAAKSTGPQGKPPTTGGQS